MSVDAARLARIHARLLDGDPSASADLVAIAYGPLIGFAMRNFGGMDEDAARDIALDVLVGLVERPDGYRSDRGAALFTYLCMALEGDVKNARAKRSRRARLFSGHVVEVRDLGGNAYHTNPSDLMDARRIMETHGSKLIKDDGDEAVLKLLLENERETDVFAQALGLGALPDDERIAAVEKRKDRIEARLKRLGERL